MLYCSISANSLKYVDFHPCGWSLRMISFETGGKSVLSLRNLKIVTAAIVFTGAAYSQVSPTNVTLDSPYQIRYASNLNIGDSVVNISNTGARGAALQSGTSASITGALCANVYTFSPDEQLISCCSCPV